MRRGRKRERTLKLLSCIVVVGKSRLVAVRGREHLLVTGSYAVVEGKGK